MNRLAQLLTRYSKILHPKPTKRPESPLLAESMRQDYGKSERTEDFYHIMPGDARSYYRERSELAFKYSTFDCLKHKCSSCCTDKIGREVTAFDIMAMALARGRLPLFGDEILLRADIFDNIGSMKPTLQLATPCKFLSDNGCGVQKDREVGKYIGKPIVCVLFPENILAMRQFLGGRRMETARNDPSLLPLLAIEDKNYPCLKDGHVVSQARFQALADLESMMCKERAASDLFFGIQARELPNFPEVPDGVPENADEKAWATFIKETNSFFAREFGNGTPFHSSIIEKVECLANREGIKKLFGLLNKANKA